MQKNASTFLGGVLWFVVSLVGVFSAEPRAFAVSSSSSPISAGVGYEGILGALGAGAESGRDADRVSRVLRLTDEAISQPSCARLWRRMSTVHDPRIAAEYLVQAAERACPGWRSHLWVALRGRDSALRGAAVELLPLILGVRALPVLSTALRSGNPGLRSAAARGMVRLGRPAIPELANAMPDVFEAAGALAEIGGRDARSALVRSWKWIRDPFAARFLPEPERRSWYLLRFSAGFGQRASGPGSPSVEDLVPVLQPAVDPAAADFCIVGLSRATPRPEALLALLASMKSSDSATVLATFLRASRPELRHEAALGLGRLGGPMVVASLAKDLRPEVPSAFLRSAEALALTNRVEALTVLLPHIKWTGAIGRSAISALGVLLRNRARFLRGPGADAMRGRALRLLRGVARAKGDPRRWWALAALGLARDPVARELGLQLVRSSDPTKAIAGCMALDGQAGDGKVARALVSLLRASDGRLGACAAWVLRDSRQEGAIVQALRDPRPMVSRNAAAALARGKFGLSALRTALQSLDRVVWTAAVAGLARRRALPFSRLSREFARVQQEERPVLLEALIVRDRDRARGFLRSLAWRFERLGLRIPGWLVRARLEVEGKILERPEENYLVLALSGKGAAGRPVWIRPRAGPPVWWFAGPDGLVVQTGLPSGPLDLTVGRAPERASRAGSGIAPSRPGTKAGDKFRGR